MQRNLIITLLVGRYEKKMTIKILIFGQGCLYFFRNIETRICSDSKIYQIKDPGYLDNEDNSNLILILDIKNSITILLK